MIASHALLDERNLAVLLQCPLLLPTLCMLVASQSPSQKMITHFVITSKQNKQKKIMTINKYFVITVLLN